MIAAEDWNKIEKELRCLHCMVKLRIDGYDVSLFLIQVKVFKNEIAVYVNGHIKGEWLTKDSEERRRFYCERKVFAHTAKFRKSLKKWGKKYLKESGVDPNQKFSYYSPSWTSFKALKAHLIKNNKDLEWVNRPGVACLIDGLNAEVTL